MADQPYTNQNQNNNQEKELLEEAEIVVRNQDGSFSVVSGRSLLGEEEKKAEKPPTPPKPIREAPKVPRQITVSRPAPVFAPEKPLSQIGKASFVVSAEDEKEIQQFRDGLEDQSELDLNAIIDQIISQTKISFADEMIQRRFRSLLASRLKEVRTPVQFSESLRASIKIGGVELKEDQASQVERLVEEKAKSIQLGQIKPVKKQDVQKIKEAEELAQRRAFQAIKDEIAQRQEKAAQQRQVAPKPILPKPPISQPEPLQPRLKEKPKVMAIPQVKRPLKEGKTRITDIKTPPKVVGPIEELRTINLKEFRQLGANPEACAQKIEEKINLLEEESLIKKVEGIKAWNQSEIYQTYLAIGHDSMAQGKSVKEVIQNRILEGKPFLTEEEFNSVADLNKRLRF